MDIGVVSVRYAKALLQFAKENKEEDAVYEEMKTLAQSFSSIETLRTTLLNPTLTDEIKTEVMKLAAVGRNPISSTSLRFLGFVVKQQREEWMQFMALSYQTLYRKDKHITQGHLIVPSEVSPVITGRMKELVQQRTHKDVNFEVTLDKSIEGGFILEYETYRLDASVRTRLRHIHRMLAVGRG